MLSSGLGVAACAANPDTSVEFPDAFDSRERFVSFAFDSAADCTSPRAPFTVSFALEAAFESTELKSVAPVPFAEGGACTVSVETGLKAIRTLQYKATGLPQFQTRQPAFSFNVSS